MSTRELILLSPYRLPTQNALYLADDDVATYLHGYRALWHPAAIAGAAGPPRSASPYDHEQPQPGFVYAVPETPPLLLPDDWDERVREAGGIAFRATPDAAATLANLRDALRGHVSTPVEAAALLDLDAARIAPFFGVGLGYLCVEALFEAMSHDNQLSTADLWTEVAAATAALTGPDADAPRRHLQSAAERLLAAREVLYPVAVHVVDLWLPGAAKADEPWPAALDQGLPLNVIACASLLEHWGSAQPERLTALRERVAANLAEVCGGPYRESEDALLPLESQLWNLTEGQATYQKLLGSEIRVFARQRFGHHHFLPLLLQSVGISKAVLLAFDEAVLPPTRGTTASWPSPDGKQVEVFCRTPLPADSPQTFFHLTHHLHRTLMQDSAATLALVHKGKPAHACYADWLALTRLAPVLGRWTTLSGYLDSVTPGEYLSPGTPDDFHGDYLVERCPAAATQPGTSSLVARAPVPEPVSGFASRQRVRRQLDTAWTLAALYRGMGGRTAGEEGLAGLEDRFESEDDSEKEINTALGEIASALAGRLTARAEPGQAGFLVLNPCAFTRRVVLELNDAQPPQGGSVKACQPEGTGARVVVEVPGLGFARVPRSGGGPETPSPMRMRLADERTVRNEFFEAEVDPVSGGLKSIRDVRTRVGRVGQQLVFNPGSAMRAREVKVSSSGPALGEVVSEGVLVDAQDEVLATFRQRFRAWIGRPTLELRIEIQPTRPPHGYPWHAYFGCRFAWRDERLTLLRGALGTSYVTSHTRPETPDFLELRQGRQSTAIFPGGLPFHQRNGNRMLDVILIPEGERATAFELGIALDREYPMQTALGLVTPAPVISIDRGPPPVGATGWLFHLDAPDLMLTTIRPAADGADAVTARLLECGFGGGSAQLRCVRDPRRAFLVDARGQILSDLSIEGDAVNLDIPRNELAHIRIEFS
jgi:hypothetical protein